MPVWRMTAAGLALVAVCYGLARFAYGLFLPAFRVEFTLDDTLLGSVAAGSYVGYCLAVLTSAVAVARVGPRATATAAGIVAACGMVVVAISPSGWILALGILVAGTSTGVASPPFAEAIARVAAHARHDRAQAIVNAGPGAGIAVSGAVALLALGAWRTAWLLFAATAVAVTIWVAATVPGRATVAGPRTRLGAGLLAVGRTRSSWRLAAGAGLFGAASAAVWTFGRDHVASTGALGPTGSTLMWVVLGVSELAGVTAGDLVVRWGLRRVWAVGLALIAGTTSAFGLAPALGPGVFSAAAVFGVAYVVLTTVVFLWATRLHPGHVAASVAFGFLAISGGQALASPLVGALAQHAGTTATFTASAILAITTAYALQPCHTTDRPVSDRRFS